MTARFALKRATDEVHQQLDSKLSRLDLACASDYRRFLHLHARTVPAIEAALARGGLGELVDGWCATRRSSAIEADLADLGEAMPSAVDAPSLNGTAELLGTAYVLEGSRLGGRVLARRVGKDLPIKFLSQSDNDRAWPTVVAALDSLLYSDPLLGEAQDAARRCFAIFLNAAHEAGI